MSTCQECGQVFACGMVDFPVEESRYDGGNGEDMGVHAGKDENENAKANAGKCWCQHLPALMPVPPSLPLNLSVPKPLAQAAQQPGERTGASCLCPACLRARLAGLVSEPLR
jgi:hypothetical protein